MEKDINIKPSGDRFVDVVDNVILYEACQIVLHYAQDIANNDDTDTEAQNCVKVLRSLKQAAAAAIGDAIE